MTTNMPRLIFATALFFMPLYVSAASIYVEHKQLDVTYDIGSDSLRGASIGFDDSNWWLGLDVFKSDTIDAKYTELNLGFKKPFIENKFFTLSGLLGVGLGVLDITSFNNKNLLITLPIGIQASWLSASGISVFVGANYKLFSEITSCNSSDSDSSTCSHYNGSSYYDDEVGNGTATELRFGAKYNFN